jgi:hypothetical protein
MPGTPSIEVPDDRKRGSAFAAALVLRPLAAHDGIWYASNDLVKTRV